MPSFGFPNAFYYFFLSERCYNPVDFSFCKTCLYGNQWLCNAWGLADYLKNFILVIILAILAFILASVARILSQCQWISDC